MDKNQITGIFIIGLIMVGFYYFNQPDELELAQMQHQRDSIELVQQSRPVQNAPQQYQNTAQDYNLVTDSATAAQRYGEYGQYAIGQEQFVTLENEKLKVILSNKGAKVYSVQLKEYKTHDGQDLILFEGDESEFNFNFFSTSNRPISTDELYFKGEQKGSNKFNYSIYLASGREMKVSYTLPEDGYLLSVSIDGKTLEQLVPRSQTTLDLNWAMDIRQVEKGRDFEQRYSGLFYKFLDDEVSGFRNGSEKDEELTTKIKWISFKDQFFATTLIAESSFASANIAQTKIEEGPHTLHMKADISVPLDGQDINYKFNFGPNHFQTLHDMGMDLDQLVDMGRGPIRWVNRIVVIPAFNFLGKYIGSYGLIILLLTIYIKSIVFPFTYKSYLSTAKMRLLKPEVDAINEKIPSDKAMERQQATQALYKRAGVNPLGGCLPMLFSMPFLFAMFRFFPGSIELRQESFLWATDLASYDAIVTWDAQIPLLSQFYGNHISLFCLLMAITNLIYTKINQEMSPSATQMPGMKGMMYMMPLMFLFMFNKYSAGLSYYYFISTLITIIQTVLMRRMVNEDALLAKLHANKSKKPKKKSKFQMRLEEMQKQQANKRK